MANDVTLPSKAAPRLKSETRIMHELGRRLVADAILTRHQLEDAVARSALLRKGFDRLLLDDQLAPEERILGLLAEITGIPFKPIASFALTPELVNRLPAQTALQYRIVPVSLANGVMTLAASHLGDLIEEESLQALLGATIRWVLCRRNDIDEAIKHFYGLGADLVRDLPASLRAGSAGTEAAP